MQAMEVLNSYTGKNEKKEIASYCRLNELKISYGKKKFETYNALKITSSENAKDIAKGFLPEDSDYREYFYIIVLNRANKVVGYNMVSQGGVSGTVVDTKVVFATALLAGGSSIILVHNHPSGTMMPSKADTDLTFKMKEGGKYLDINVLDHIIVSGESDEYFSYADEAKL